MFMEKKDTLSRVSDDYSLDFKMTFKLEIKKTALIIVDMQYATTSRTAGLGKLMTSQGREYLINERFERIENVIVPNIQKALKYCLKNGIRVIYIKNGAELPDFSDVLPYRRNLDKATNNIVGSREHEILDELKPIEGELVIHKKATGAFNASTLDQALRSMQIEYLMFTGVSTHLCVDLTARDAADRGYKCVLIEDCLGAPKFEYHNSAILIFQLYSGRVETLDTIISELEKEK